VKRFPKSCLTVGLSWTLLTVSIQSAFPQHHGLKSDPAITIRVYNFAQVSARSLIEAEKETTSIFQEVGINPLWVDCPLTHEESSNYPECQQAIGLMDFHLRIFSQQMAERYGKRFTTFGFSVPCPDDGRGCVSNVFLHRVEELAKRTGATLPGLMGHVIAHEIGHLLLGLTQHGPTGIMRAYWDREDLRRAALGHLVFTRDEANAIRNRVARRAERQEANQATKVVVRE
jgi:hypothetical protein